MGPYYRDTAQGMGRFLDSFYQYPILMLLLVVVVAGVATYVWRKAPKE
jgi:hypothetical protein